MKLLRIVAVVAGILASAAFGQSNSQASNQSQSTASPAPSKAPEPDAQNNLTSTDSKSDSQSDHHRIHVRLGTIGVSAGYTRFSGPFFYNPFLFGYYPYGFYDPFFPSPFFAPGFFEGYAFSPDKGEVKLSGAPKNAEVFLNGGYAGTANKLKTMWLEPGAYDLSISTQDSASFHQRIYVLSGKTLKIAAKLSLDKDKDKGDKSKTEEKQ